MTQILYLANIENERMGLINQLRTLKEQNPNLRVLDVGAWANPLSEEFLTHTFDLHHNPNLPDSVVQYIGNINDYNGWHQIFQHVNEYGKFDYITCTHTLEDIAFPQAALKYMPQLAKRGFIAVPSKYYELQRRDLFRGSPHHRWIWNDKDGKLIGYPKSSIIEYINYQPHNKGIEDMGFTELRLEWEDEIDWGIINDDYLGPNDEAVRKMYEGLMP